MNDWLSTQSTQELILALSNSITGISAMELVHVSKGGNVYSRLTGTWIHPKLVLPLAHWLSPEFYLWCNDKFTELLSAEKERLLSAAEETIKKLMAHPELEKVVQRVMEESTDGKYGTYLKLNNGIPDLVTDRYIMEIKRAENHKAALGQLVAYRAEMIRKGLWDNRYALLYLFDPNNWLDETKKEMIRDNCVSVDVEVNWFVNPNEVAFRTPTQRLLAEDIRSKLEAQRLRYKITYPSGKTLLVANLSKWCGQNNVDISQAHQVCKGNGKTAKGFKFEYLTSEIANESRSDRQKQCAFKGILIAQELVSGLVYAIEDISSWHKDRGIKSMGNVYSVLNGSRKSSYGHKFWRLETCPEEILGQVRM